MPTVYVVHSRVIALCERPFYYGNPLRPVWKNFFENHHCFQYPISASSHADLRALGQRERQRFISGVGALRSTPNPLRAFPVKDEKILVRGLFPQYHDQRMSLLFLEFSEPISLRSKGYEDARAWGNFYVHIYPSGYLVVHLALTLNWQRDRSSDEIAALVAETYPWRVGSSWRWQSKIGRGRIHNLYLRLRTYLYSSFFESRRTMLREGSWRTVVKHCDLLSSEQLAASLWPGETYDVLMLTSSLIQSILFTSPGAILHLCDHEGRCGRRLACFWRMMQFYERVLLEEQIHADYFSAMLEGLQQLSPLLSGQVEMLGGEKELHRIVLDRRIPEYLSSLKNHREQLSPFCKRIQAGFAFWFGLVAQQTELLATIQGWEEEMREQSAELPVKWAEISPTLQSVLTAYEPIDPDWIMAQKGESNQCLVWFSEP